MTKDLANIETADTILHKPSGEKWYVAYCRDGYVCCCGWPCTEARVEDCELIEKGSLDDREDLLRQMANIRPEPPSYYDPRQSYAAHHFYELAESTAGAGI